MFPEEMRGDFVENVTVYPGPCTEETGSHVILGFRIKKGRWIITERPENMRYGIPAVQWIYTDDFCLLHLTSGNNSVDAMADLVITKIDDIASSIREGNRVRSHIENEVSYRESVKTLLIDPSRPKPAITGTSRQQFHRECHFHKHRAGERE